MEALGTLSGSLEPAIIVLGAARLAAPKVVAMAPRLNVSGLMRRGGRVSRPPR
jgi:hypothetical protein